MVVDLGMLFFLKYAWEQGWLAFSPKARVMSAIGAGVLLEMAGEWVRRRGMRVLAGTLGGAEVAIVMAAFLAGHSCRHSSAKPGVGESGPRPLLAFARHYFPNESVMKNKMKEQPRHVFCAAKMSLAIAVTVLSMAALTCQRIRAKPA